MTGRPAPAARGRTTVVLAFSLLLGCGGGGGQPAAPGPVATPPAAPASSVFTYAGATHVSWWHDQYLHPEAAAARAHLASTGGSWAGVLVTWYMDRADASTMAPDTLRTPSDAAVLQSIADLRSRGLKVMLKPHVDVKDDTWRGSIRPRDAGTWFASYTEFIVHYARMADAAGVELYCVGTELVTLSGAGYRASWEAVIAAVRAAYRGPLTYAANATTAGDEFTSVAFWDRVDIAGLDAYVPLTDRLNPSRAELEAAWSRNRNGQNMVAAFRNWQASHRLPVFMTELGYRSADGTNRAPYDYAAAAPPDPGEQADCYAAAFAVWSRESSWMKGILWWAWAVPPPGPADTDYTPRGKPAEEVLRQWQQS